MKLVIGYCNIFFQMTINKSIELYCQFSRLYQFALSMTDKKNIQKLLHKEKLMVDLSN